MRKVIYGDGYDALRMMCEGRKSQEIAHYLISEDGIWKGKTLETGAARVRACLNHDKNEFFKISEIIAISKYTKCFDAVLFMCDELGLSHPQPVSIHDQLGEISRVIAGANQALSVATEQLTRIEKHAQHEVEETQVLRSVNFCLESKKP